NFHAGNPSRNLKNLSLARFARDAEYTEGKTTTILVLKPRLRLFLRVPCERQKAFSLARFARDAELTEGKKHFRIKT
ncbi:MAG: hypothetical protein NTX30_08435, partial [Deltaproteobacteria bacterium]|nr:hypothetical protein [Deltaproteobacteria bacterium]